MFTLFSKYKKAKSACTYVAVGLFVFVQVFGFLLVPQPVYALPVTDAGTLGAITGQTVNDTVTKNKEEVKQNIGNVLLSTLMGALMQGVSYFTRKLAYDAATFIASGGKGQGSQVFGESAGEYFANVAGDSLATAVEEIGQPFGLNLCSPPNIKFQAFLQVGIRGLYPEPSGDGPKPSCSWQELNNNWSNWDVLEDPVAGLGLDNFRADNAEEFFQKNVRTSQSDFGIALGAIATVDRTRIEAKEAANLERLEGQGFKAVTDPIAGNVKTPGQVVQEETKALTANNQQQLTSQQIAGIYGAGALQILPTAASVFLNTLTSQLLNNLIGSGGGLVPNTVSDSTYTGSPGGARREAAQRAFSFLLSTPVLQTDEIDIIAEFNACPQIPGLNNCVIDNGLFQALIRAEQGQPPMTIQEAMDEGLLHADWPLISYLSPDNGNIQRCASGMYCYSNIQKMRRLRLVPLGFEIAAAESDISQPVTLGEVVANFENCGQRNPDGTPVNPDDPAFPYCHLIDPNWVLKAPVARCEALVYGPEIFPNTDSRKQECVDVSTCVSFNEDGTCEQFGYCTREANVWSFPGETCAPQHATCEVYENTQTGETASYLGRTVDIGSCDADSVGCRAYSTEQVGDSWISSGDVATNNLPLGSIAAYQAVGRNPLLHFDIDITAQSCPEGSDGCRRLIIGSEIIDDGLPTRRTFEYARNNAGDLQFLNMRLAPPSLGCYDTDPETPAIEYPTTRAELALVSSNEACSDYAAVCVESEVGCELHTPLAGGGVSVPGVVGANACAAACVGYDTFSQLESEFEGEEDPLYFIPSNAESCSAQHVGCSEFTNLDELARGGEAREYYSEIKYCEKPEGENRDNEKTFYAYEGSAQEGFVLRIYRLKQVDSQDSALLASLLTGAAETELSATGSPMYADLTTSELEDNYARCNETSYNALINGGANPADPDCREFFDDNENYYYRLLEKTVTVSEQCVPLRITNPDLFVDTTVPENLCEDVANGFWDAGVCNRCRGGGFYDRGECIYNSITSEATQCPATANECRAYSGNFAGNVQRIFDLDFEPTSQTPDAIAAILDPWTTDNVTVSSESLQLGGNSVALDIDQDVAIFDISNYQIPRETVYADQYQLRFWAKSDSTQDLTVRWSSIEDGTLSILRREGSTENHFTVGAEWREYVLYSEKIPDVIPDGNPNTIQFVDPVIIGTSPAPIYIDNLQFTRVNDTQYFIKDSWQVFEDGVLKDVPAACDSNPLDAFPGEALGCQAYAAQNSGATVYATGFEQLCRPEAVGCYAFYDTYNTDTQAATVYKAWCTEGTCDCPNGVPGLCNLEYNEQILGSCTVRPGQTGCYVDQITYPDDVQLTEAFIQNQPYITASSIVIPSDTPEERPLFLAAREEALCDGDNFLGCVGLGLEQQILPDFDSASYEFSKTYVLNDPALYGSTLCSNNQIGCGEFQSTDSIRYFKDPKVTGAALCQYREDDGEGTPGTGGWFFNDIGRCDNDQTKLCKTDAQCGVGSCTGIGTTACYPNEVDRNGRFRLLSNDNPDYSGYVGMCPRTADQCTEFIDRVDISVEYPGGRPYYVIFDDIVENRIGECQGQASLREGCVLFDQTGNPAKLYNAAQTYVNSEADIREGGDGLVIPERGTGFTKDSNIILKVDRDKQCSEWLACRNEVTYRDENGNPITLCLDYDRCVEADGTRCNQFVGPENGSGLASQLLTKGLYASRDTSWYGDDYSGYSLFERYPVADYSYTAITVSGFDKPNTSFLAYAIPNEVMSGTTCVAGGVVRSDFTPCGPSNAGLCLEGTCMLPIDGAWPTNYTQSSFVQNPDGVLVQNTCKGFPEETSPFPWSVLSGGAEKLSSPNGQFTRWRFPEKKNQFSLANVCQNEDCSCSYQKITFQDQSVDYWNALTPNVPKASCVGGPRDGSPCAYDPSNATGPGLNNECADTQNGANGVCRPAISVEKRLGTYGYCLERDLSRPINGGGAEPFACATWLPLGVSASQMDTFNQRLEAGYYPVSIYDAPEGGGQVYCTHSTANGAGAFDTSLFYYQDAIMPLGSINDINSARAHGRVWAGGQNQGQPSAPLFSSIFETYTQSENYSFHLNTNVENFCHFNIDRAGVDDGGTDQNPYSANAVSERYEDYICISGGAVDRRRQLYTLLQLWAMRFIGTNATILRMETIDRPIDNNIGFGTEGNGNEWGKWHGGTNDHVCNSGSAGGCQVFALLPLTKGDTSVLMHPPREFVYERQTGRQMSKVIGVHTEEEAEVLTFTDMHSAAQVNLGGAQERLVVSDIQESLNDSFIERVYIVPLSYPGGADFEFAPRILSDELFIDVASLKSAVDSGNLDAPRAFTHTGLWTKKQGNQDQIFVNTADYDRRSDSTWFTYVLERDTGKGQCEGLLSYCSYNSNGYRYNGPVDPNDPRQKIDRRYVGVWFQSENDKALFATQFAPSQPDQDPFTMPCRESSVLWEHMWFAIGLDFNEDGEFLGYISRYCGSFRGSNGIQTAVIATLKDQCLGMASIYDPANEADPNNPSNKAWTDRVWRYSSYQFDLGGFSSRDLLLGTSKQPFATLSDVRSEDLAQANILRAYTFDDARRGTPLSCPTGKANNGSYINNSGRIRGSDIMSRLFGCDAMVSPLGNYDYGYDDSLRSSIAVGLESRTAAKDAILNQLFAKIFQWNFYGQNEFTSFLNYEQLVENDGANRISGPDLDNSEFTGGAQLAPPRVHALNPDTCGATNLSAVTEDCTAGFPNTFSINGHTGLGVTYGNTRDNPRALYAFGKYFATARFFAFADHNRMPIRQVVMDWNDGGGANSQLSSKGRYQNRKPFCAPQDDASGIGECRVNGTLNGVTCENDAQCSIFPGTTSCDTNTRSFGNSPRACQEGYFQYSYTYTCTDADYASFGTLLSDPQIDDSLRNVIATTHELDPATTQVCVYRPRVQIKDNWGFCNASDPDPELGLPPTPTNVLQAALRSWTPRIEGDQDERGVVSSGADRCRTNLVNPWTYFGSTIIVIKVD